MPVESLTVRSTGMTRVVPLPPARELVPLVTDAIGAVIDDLVGAIRGGRPPVATADDGLHALGAEHRRVRGRDDGRHPGVPLDRATAVPPRVGRSTPCRPEWSAVRRDELFVDRP